jgi:plastocyanin
MEFKVTVQREGVAKPGFSPQQVQAQVGDSVFWFNADRNTQHQPYLVYPGDWAANPIEPNETSTQVNTDQCATFHYRCALHPDEVGVVLVCTAVMIGPVGDGTSAFSMAPPPAPPPQPNQPPPPTLGLPQLPGLAVPQTFAGTSVSFGNADSQGHWPMPQGGSKTAWLNAAINPGDISAPVPFDTVQNLTYQCALHPAETGPLNVIANPVTVYIGSSETGPTPAPAVQFYPEFLQVVVGQTVTFSNLDAAAHQPAPDGYPDGEWFPNQIGGVNTNNVPQIPVNGTCVFLTPGTFWYHDALNPNMKGIIQVGQS